MRWPILPVSPATACQSQPPPPLAIVTDPNQNPSLATELRLDCIRNLSKVQTGPIPIPAQSRSCSPVAVLRHKKIFFSIFL